MHLIGSGEPASSGPIALTGPGGGQKSLLLVADPAHADRPPGTDPLDIRDLVDWLEPVLTLDLEKLKSEVAARLPRTGGLGRLASGVAGGGQSATAQFLGCGRPARRSLSLAMFTAPEAR